MSLIGKSAYTDHGIGTISEEINERGRLSYRVAGKGFSVWVEQAKLRVANEDVGFSFGPMEHWKEQYADDPEAQQLSMIGGLESTIIPGDPYTVNERNHTTLPYDYSPQYPVDLFRKEQTILPGDYEIDPDKRLHPSDSVSGNRSSEPRGPQPNNDLFLPRGDHPFANERTSGAHEKPFAMSWQGEHGRHEAPEGPRHAAPPTHMVPMGDEEYDSYINEDPRTGGGLHETWPMPKGEGGPGHYPSGGDFHTGGLYRPAGLSDKYAYVPVEAADANSPVAQFRRDPVGFIRTCGHLWTDGDDTLHHRFADYTNLLDTDEQFRTAAWSDVRKKAKRLRSEGKVQVNDISHNRIYATVQGDHGTYDVMLAKSGALPTTQSVADWTCSCDWGRWAFKRTMTYIGRLCSHAYAAYQTMQSQYLKDNPQHFQKGAAAQIEDKPDSFGYYWDDEGNEHDPDEVKKPKHGAASVEDYKSWLKDNSQAPEAGSIANYLNTQANDASDEEVHKLYDYVSDNPDEVPERDYDIPYVNDPEKAYKQADLLRQVPQSLSPDLRAVPEGEDNRFVDVTEDERETTGPDQIVHFSSVDTLRALHGASEGITDFSSGGGVGGSAGATMPSTPGTGGNSLPDMSTPSPDGDSSGGLGLSGVSPDDPSYNVKPPGPQSLSPSAIDKGLMASRRYAESSDAQLLDKLRDMSAENPDDYGHMDEHNEELRYLVDQLQQRGYDASYMVAAREDTPSDGNGGFLGQSGPDYPDKGFAGSGPDPKDWISDSAGYVDENERPDFGDVTDFDGEDIIKFNDSRSQPEQGPRHSYRQADNFSPDANLGGAVPQEPAAPGLGGGDLQSPDTAFDPAMTTASLHHADDSGYFNPNNTGDADWQAGSGEDFADAVGQQVSDLTDPLQSGGSPSGAPAEGEAGAAGEGAAGAAAGGEGGAAAAGGAARMLPLLMANQQKQADFDPVAAFDSGQFSFGDDPGVGAPGGELRRASRLGGGPTQQVRVDPGGRGWQRQAGPGQQPPEDFGYDGGRELEAYLADDGGDPTGSDILANFQRSAAAGAVMAEPAPRAGASDDFASSPMVQSFLRTAGRVYTPEQQRELEAEYHPMGARNLPTDEDLAGTHYLAM